jgi:hypothetical protein
MGRNNNDFSKGLFHGTDADLNPGDLVEPRTDDLTWASTNREVAATYGSKIYSVEPAEDTHRHPGALKKYGIYHSRIGFKVKGLAE